MSKRLHSAAALEQRLSALKGQDWDSEDEAEAPREEELISLPAPEPTRAAKRSKTKAKGQAAAASDPDEMAPVIYIGHIPHGFYEQQMRGFFSQFGEVVKLRLARSKKTGGSKGFAFVEFTSVEDAQVVAEAMDKYMLAGKQLVVQQVPMRQVHPKLFDGHDKPFVPIKWREIARVRHNKKRSLSEQRQVNRGLIKKESAKRKRLAASGIEYEFPGYAAEMVEQAEQSPAAHTAAPTRKRANPAAEKGPAAAAVPVAAAATPKAKATLTGKAKATPTAATPKAKATLTGKATPKGKTTPAPTPAATPKAKATAPATPSTSKAAKPKSAVKSSRKKPAK